MNAATENFREQLKSQTKQEHMKMESASSVMKDSFTLKQYQEILVNWHGFHTALEQALQSTGYLEIQNFMKTRSKVAYLENDLRHFTLRPSLEKLQQAKEFLYSNIQSPESLWGILYVLEGSTLGAQFITKHLSQKFELTNDGIQFYKGYGSSTGINWKEFVEKLQSLDFERESIEKGVSAAQNTFRFLAKYL